MWLPFSCGFTGISQDSERWLQQRWKFRERVNYASDSYYASQPYLKYYFVEDCSDSHVLVYELIMEWHISELVPESIELWEQDRPDTDKKTTAEQDTSNQLKWLQETRLFYDVRTQCQSYEVCSGHRQLKGNFRSKGNTAARHKSIEVRPYDCRYFYWCLCVFEQYSLQCNST